MLWAPTSASCVVSAVAELRVIDSVYAEIRDTRVPSLPPRAGSSEEM